MLIAVNTRLLIKDKMEGIGWFTYETLKRITQQHPEHQFLFFFDRPFDKEFLFAKNITPIIINPPTRHPFLWYIWFEWSLPGMLKKYKPDLFLSTDGWLPLKAMCPTINVIHDLNMLHYPQYIKWIVRQYYFVFFPKFAQKATRLATVSEYSKQDISNLTRRSVADIDVVFNGCNNLYQVIPEEIKKGVKKKYSGGCDFFLFIGLVHPRKNMVNLFKAFDLFKGQTDSKVKLLIVGEIKWWTKDIVKTYNSLKHKNEVILTGRLSNEELKPVLGSALALTYVPIFEGFGIPILEAFNAGIPVITSSVTSMPEVAGDAAILVNPFSIEEISVAMQRVYESPVLREELIAKGNERAKKFSWDKTARLLWQCIEKVIP